jgi:hypothetical protein
MLTPIVRITRRGLVRFSLLGAIALTFAPIHPSTGAAAQPTANATPPATPAPHPFAGETAWIAYYGSLGIGLIHPDGSGNQWVAADATPGE